MTRLSIIALLFPLLAGCAGTGGDGLKVAVSLPTKVQAGAAGSSDGNTHPVARVTDWQPWVINGDEDDEHRF